jgi:hypothetical protein
MDTRGTLSPSESDVPSPDRVSPRRLNFAAASQVFSWAIAVLGKAAAGEAVQAPPAAAAERTGW